MILGSMFLEDVTGYEVYVLKRLAFLISLLSNYHISKFLFFSAEYEERRGFAEVASVLISLKTESLFVIRFSRNERRETNNSGDGKIKKSFKSFNPLNHSSRQKRGPIKSTLF
jgi:hypothetical protein